MPGLEITASHAAFLQTATAVVQAIVATGLLIWYVLASHIDRLRKVQERAEEFESLVRLCQGLGLEAQARIATCRQAVSDQQPGDDVVQQLTTAVAAWKADMEVIYVCLNEVPHFEVRSPCFSIALTRLWLEVDARSVVGSEFGSIADFKKFLERKHGSIGREIGAMAEVTTRNDGAAPRTRRSLTMAVQRRRKGDRRVRVSVHDNAR
jgi:hypothetical protein